MGLRYAFADFINPRGAANAEVYRRSFVASERLAEPQLAVAVRGLVAASESEAERLSSSWRMAFDLLRRGRLVAVPPPEKAERYFELHPEQPPQRRRLTGTAEQVRADIEATVAAYGAEEAIVVTIAHEHSDPAPLLRAAGRRVRAYGRVKRSQFLVRPSRGRDMY